jgi:hypothetical protein
LTKSLPLITEALCLCTWKKRDCAIYSVVKEPLHRSPGANCHVLRSIRSAAPSR